MFHLHLHIMGGRQLVSGHRPLRPQLGSFPTLQPTACILVKCVGQVGKLLKQHDKQPITCISVHRRGHQGDSVGRSYEY